MQSSHCKIAALTRERDELRAELAAAKSRTLPAIWRQQQPTPTSCFRACVATILKIPVDEVTRACDGDSWDWDAFQDWLKPRGLQAVEVIMDRDGPVLYPIPHGVPVILTGKSPRPCPSGQHAVVAKSIGLDGFDLVHDPHEANEFIEGDAKFATFFAVIKPDGITAQLTAERAAHEATKARLAEVERENKQLREQVAQGGPLNAERWTLDELLTQLEQWKSVASGQTCVSFANLCYGASSLWHQTHRENFRRIDRQPEALSRWVLEFDGSIKEDFPAQVLALLERFFTERNELRDKLTASQAAQLAAEVNAEFLLKSLRECQAQAAAMREAWGRVAGFATCVSDQGKYRVEIAYPTLEQAQDAYGAMSEITEALGRELLAEVERLRGSAEPSADLP